MHLFWQKKKTLSHVFISPRDILWSWWWFGVCVWGWVGGCARKRKNLPEYVLYSKKVMGLPEWNVSHGHTHTLHHCRCCRHCHCFPITLYSSGQLDIGSSRRMMWCRFVFDITWNRRGKIWAFQCESFQDGSRAVVLKQHSPITSLMRTMGELLKVFAQSFPWPPHKSSHSFIFGKATIQIRICWSENAQSSQY